MNFSTFQCQRLLKCGDINPNPGPTKYPCACCERPCKNNQRALQCDGCNSWCHAKCTRVSQDEYNRLSSTDDTWYCNACTFKWLSDSFFSDSTEDSLNNSNSTNSDTSEPNVIADYKASIAAYYKFNLSIAHQNINSLQNKMDEIRVLLNQELLQLLRLFYYNALQLLRSYLTGRKQHVKTDGILSDWQIVRCGVPQGSILYDGPQGTRCKEKETLQRKNNRCK